MSFICIIPQENPKTKYGITIFKIVFFKNKEQFSNIRLLQQVDYCGNGNHLKIAKKTLAICINFYIMNSQIAVKAWVVDNCSAIVMGIK